LYNFNTIGTIKFISDPTGLNVGYWKLVLPYEVPRCNIMIPGYSNWWSNGAPMAPIYSNPSKSYGVVINPGYCDEGLLFWSVLGMPLNLQCFLSRLPQCYEQDEETGTDGG